MVRLTLEGRGGCFVLVASIVAGFAPKAHAQYKNTAFSIDGGYSLITKPSIVDDSGAILSNTKRPMRLSNGFRLGGEGNVKMNTDSMWFVTRLNINFLQYGASSDGTPVERTYDDAAKEALGTLIGVQGMFGIRYYFLTDKIKPYVQSGVSYMRLFSFSNDAESGCTIAAICPSGNNETNFLPHPNIGGFHIQPGLEIFLDRDLSLHLYGDYQRWLVLNADDNHSITFAIGMAFYT